MIDLRVPAQIAAVWIVMALSATVVGWLVLFGFFVRSPVLVAIGLLGPFAVAFLIGTFTAAASPLTATPLRRVGWAVLVTAAGLVGVVFYEAVLESVEPAKPPSWLAIPAVGVPFALAAATMAHGLVLRLVAAGVTVAAVAYGIWLPTTMPDDDVASRIAHARPPAGVVLIARPDGYAFPDLTTRDGQAELSYRRESADAPLSGFPRVVVRPATVDAPETGDDAEPVYRPVSAHHVFVRRMGDVEAVATVSKEVDVAVARDFVQSVRPARDDEVMRLLKRAPDRRDRDVLRRFADTWRRLFD
ncbi:hypothetical protein [Saccharothrix hoggarensis]|uniref:Uncharacterized protein n=1 Tax=Saccharothrix hoggarensis TaxID=913853 RepID=A0ABW3R1L7_9PSEU